MRTRHERLPVIPPPDLEPAGIIRQGWSAYARNAVAIILMNAVVAAVSIALMVPDRISNHIYGKNPFAARPADHQTWLVLVTLIYVGMVVIALLSAYFSAGLCLAYLKAVRGERVRFRDLFSGGRYWGSVFLASILVGLYIFGGLLLFVVPGLYFCVVLVLTPFFIVDKGHYAYKALHSSWDVTKPYWREFLPVYLVVTVLYVAAFGGNHIPYVSYAVTAAERLILGPVAGCWLAVLYVRLTAPAGVPAVPSPPQA